MKKLSFILYCLFFIGIGYFGTAVGVQYYTSVFPKKHKILVMISSYKRPLLLSGQIIRFQNQTYQNFDISVSIKGAPENWVKKMFMQEWQPLMAKGRLFVRFDENKNQLSNHLDTLRDIDLDKYDYFCKVDDDDWYVPTYLEHVNDWLNKNTDIAMSASRNAAVLEEDENTAKMKMFYGETYGPTMCFSREVMKIAFEVEKDASALEPYIDAKTVEFLRDRREDNLLDRIAKRTGKIQFRNDGIPRVIYGKQYPGVTRPWLGKY